MAISGQSNLKRYLPWIIGGAAAVFVALLAAVALLFFLLSGKVVVSGLTTSQDSVTLGQTVVATVKLENQGRLNHDYHLALLVDGKETATRDLSLKGRETREVPIDLTDLSAGDHKISMADYEKNIRILTPAAFTVADLRVDPPTCTLGESVTLRATIRNTGETAGVYTADAMMDGSSLPSQTVQVEPGSTNDVQITVASAGPGAHSLSLDNSSTNLQVLRPADITVTSWNASSQYVPLNKDLSLTVTLSNAGDIDGTYDLQVWINGEAQPVQSVAVPAQQSVDVPLTYQFTQAGTYEFKTGNDQALTIYAVEIQRPKNGALLNKKANGGSGRLTLVNNYDRDALFVLASSSDPSSPLLSVYVQGNSTAKNIKVKDGDYIIFYSLGNDFDGASKRFITDVSYSRFTDPIDFSTTRSGGYITYSIWTITLNSDSGNSSTDTVPADQFPQ